MHTSTFFGLFSLVAMALAAPSNLDVRNSKSCKTSYTANFDDLAASPVDELNTIPTPYDFLSYSGFVLAMQGIVQTIKPHTPPNSIAFNTLTQVTKGGAPTISTSYKSSKVQYFNLNQLYMGCVAMNPTGVFVATACTVQAIGTKTDGSKVYNTLNFKAPLVPVSNLPVVGSPAPEQVQNFPDRFNNLQSVTFQITSSGVANVVTAVSFDSIKYDVYTSC